MSDIEKQSKLQALYMEALRAKAINAIESIAEKDPSSLAFDPQGRVLIDVKLDSSDLEKINENLSVDEKVNSLEEVKGYSPANSKMATVSVDVGSSELMYAAFKSKMHNGEPPVNPVTVDKYMSIERGSVIPLQQEMHFHMAGAQRVLTEKIAKINFNGKDKQVEQAFKEATLKVNKLVQAEFNKALNASVDKDGNINIAKLNKQLDKARKAIAPESHRILLSSLAKNTGVEFRGMKIDAKTISHLAEETTATANDVLFLDSQAGIATLVKGTEQTAHNRLLTKSENEGPSFAHRQLITQPLGKGGITANKRARIQIRTPSPVVKDGAVSSDDKIIDVVNKFTEISKNYKIQDNLNSSDQSIPKTFIYNRYTAINDTLDNMQGKNKQTESAGHILKASHNFNEEQANKGADGVMCFVQNLSVNGFGASLGYGRNELLNESTLMTEMAILHTNYDQLDDDAKNKFKDVIDNYKAFLNDATRGDVFVNSEQGKNTKKQIKEIKESIKKSGLKTLEDSATPSQLAQRALLNMMANDKHCHHKHAKTMQALSVFVESASIGGCKSGNERAEAINKRVSVLDIMEVGKKGLPEINVLNAVLHDCASDSPSAQAFNNLDKALNSATNNLALQSAATIISHSDQMAGAKVQAQKKGFNPKHNLNRNYAESNDMTNLKQTKASKMQAHKSFGSYLESATKPRKAADFKLPYVKRNLFERFKRWISGADKKEIKQHLQAEFEIDKQQDMKSFNIINKDKELEPAQQPAMPAIQFNSADLIKGREGLKSPEANSKDNCILEQAKSKQLSGNVPASAQENHQETNGKNLDESPDEVSINTLSRSNGA